MCLIIINRLWINNMFLYQKLIDRSTLRQGFQIPVEFHHLLKAMLEVIVESMNNNTSNIIILSPSYHRIIHKAKPVFDRPSLSFHEKILIPL